MEPYLFFCGCWEFRKILFEKMQVKRIIVVKKSTQVTKSITTFSRTAEQKPSSKKKKPSSKKKIPFHKSLAFYVETESSKNLPPLASTMTKQPDIVVAAPVPEPNRRLQINITDNNRNQILRDSSTKNGLLRKDANRALNEELRLMAEKYLEQNDV